ncbi:hypothetical protein UFOVP453_38 [uncultured Caudovirales phage]|uniref:Uncharacterized protein n=1 Tax=uncultured Caudovirales phage TaxID=2100421 RepID=A0A6J5MGG9_9CAUD|nr:hypothetical protein UFOVP453_38 [uncultured Caudovirales phage]
MNFDSLLIHETKAVALEFHLMTTIVKFSPNAYAISFSTISDNGTPEIQYASISVKRSRDEHAIMISLDYARTAGIGANEYTLKIDTFDVARTLTAIIDDTRHALFHQICM